MLFSTKYVLVSVHSARTAFFLKDKGENGCEEDRLIAFRAKSRKSCRIPQYGRKVSSSGI